jgi:hypothetical protein
VVPLRIVRALVDTHDGGGVNSLVRHGQQHLPRACLRTQGRRVALGGDDDPQPAAGEVMSFTATTSTGVPVPLPLAARSSTQRR